MTIEFKYNEGVGGRLDLLSGDCVEVMRGLPDNSIDAVVTDPPYGLSKEPDAAEMLRHWLAGDDYQHRGGGFMGKTWDSFVPGPEVWREVMRVLKPGGHVLSFYGTRTYDLGVLAMRLAGFEIRDQLAWMYGSGFPKSLDVSKAIDKDAGAEREVVGPGKFAARKPNGTWVGDVYGDEPAHGQGPQTTAPATDEAKRWNGWGTALKPAQEPIVLARKPLVGTVAHNVMAHGTGGINVDGCRIESGSRPLMVRTETIVGANSMSGQSTGATSSGETTDLGRWPANVLLDEDAAAMLDEQSGQSRSPSGQITQGGDDHFSIGSGNKKRGTKFQGHGDSGGASRFFYCAKSSKKEREAGLEGLPLRSGGELTEREDGSDGLNSPRAGAGRGGGRRNHHPTVKPIALMRYLVRLITPPGGTVLDPFMGSGSTGCAALMEGFGFVGIEMQGEYMEIARRRIEHWRHRA